MKRKTLLLLSILTISATLLSGCKSADSVDNSETIETTAIESEATEGTETTESTESTEVVEETEIIEDETIEKTEIPFEKGEPLSEKDLEFPFLGYNTYIEYIAAGNTGSVYMIADNANMIISGEFVDEGDVVESTVRGIKLGDNIEKIFEVYGPADEYDTYGRDLFSHDGREDVDQYLYFLETENYSYSFRFITDQYGDLIGFLLEPFSKK